MAKRLASERRAARVFAGDRGPRLEASVHYGEARDGYTLIELMVVLAIIAILSLSAIPVYLNSAARSQVEKALDWVEGPQDEITAFYRRTREFPQDNAAAGLPIPEELIGNYVERVEVVNGAIHLHLGHKINQKLDGEVVSLRPTVVEGSPATPISWTCGHAEPPDGMRAVGDNRTTAPGRRLPVRCRKGF